VVEEMKDVVSRKFLSKKSELDLFFLTFPFDFVYTPEYFDTKEYPQMRDDSDLPVLISAILGAADVLISGDKDFCDVEIDRPEILTPAEFLERYCPT